MSFNLSNINANWTHTEGNRTWIACDFYNTVAGYNQVHIPWKQRARFLESTLVTDSHGAVALFSQAASLIVPPFRASPGRYEACAVYTGREFARCPRVPVTATFEVCLPLQGVVLLTSRTSHLLPRSSFSRSLPPPPDPASPPPHRLSLHPFSAPSAPATAAPSASPTQAPTRPRASSARATSTAA